MINRDDMLELTRRMTPARTCFDRISGAYVDESGEIEDTFNIHFGKLSNSEKARNLLIAKAIPFAKTNIQIKEYHFSKKSEEIHSMKRLLKAIQECGLKNDALMDILYEQLADGYAVSDRFCILRLMIDCRIRKRSIFFMRIQIMKSKVCYTKY